MLLHLVLVLVFLLAVGVVGVAGACLVPLAGCRGRRSLQRVRSQLQDTPVAVCPTIT